MGFFHVSQQSALNQNLAGVQGRVSISFESFSLRTSEIGQILRNSIDRLSSLKPKFISVTYSANSGERDHTYGIIKGIKDRTGLEATLHLTRIDATPDELRTTTHDYWNSGICHAAALRGGLPSGSDKPEMYASGPVTLLKEVANSDISVAVYPEAHPGAKNVQAGLFNLKRKVDAGANYAITQFSSDAESYLRFHDRCVSAGIGMEIIPGILPVPNSKQTEKFADITNVRIPAQMAQMSGGPDDDAETRKLVGMNIAVDMVKVLSREGVEDFHFYTLNRVEMNYAICHTLGVRPGL